MHHFRVFFLVFFSVVLMAGCSVMAPPYSASITNVQKLKEAGTQMTKVGDFASSKDQGNANPISIRGSSMKSPYQDSYSKYVEEAIKQELSLANRGAPNADVEVTGTLLKNDLDATGFSKGSGDIEARFIVKKSGQILYDQVKSVHHEWPSSFVGAVAIPRAIEEYPTLVQKLLTSLYADQNFLDALK
ncbi:hypothetical protein [Collimonas sp. OK412]|jgi:hypothetical protein|uniref:hypothetical protein n=1 Tax=Collimonas sp. (strain OK412) TaxID=1801619 RepID=UPI0008E64BFB|nr:hypothetical protein [Collimonas sp. OK412]SFC98096.1 hypothetical protein SAMN04515619_11835 [Collimonas sp. OK412]